MSEGFTFRDKRAAAPRNLIITGESVESAKRAVTGKTYEDALRLGRTGAVDDPDFPAMRKARMRKSAGATNTVTMAPGRPQDPMWYWQQNNLPYDVSKREELVKIRDFCRLLYMTHPVIASCIDIFSKYPILGLELTCKDPALTTFYTDLFMDQLDYEEFLEDFGREYWTVGEAWPLGSFNEDMGVWEDDELLNPNDCEPERSPFLKEPRYKIKLPETLRNVLTTRQPAHEYAALIRAYPELARFTREDDYMPVSNILLKQVKFKADTFHVRGIPLLMRAIRAVRQEEMLNAAQDAIADRLYTPLILARLGASATDLGTSTPWVPNDRELQDFEESIDAALMGDFRILTTHFATQMDSVFGREAMPNFDPDFERLTERILQVFGLSKTMLSGAGSGETYAADALNRDLVSQLLTTFQRRLRKFMKDRMLVVAEAQEHFDYESRGGKRYPVMEEVLEVDEETGEKRIVEQPKLLVPDIHLKTMNMQNEDTQRQFFEALRASGVPISIKSRLVNTPIKFEDEIEQSREEQVELAVQNVETQKQTYLALKAKNLPIPPDLKAMFEPKALDAPGQQGDPAAQGGAEASGDGRLPQMGIDDRMNNAIAPSMPVQMMPPGDLEQGGGAADPGAAGATVIPMPQNQIMQPGRTRPPESDEMRGGMPRPAALTRTAADMFTTEEVEHLGGEDAIGEELTRPGNLLNGPRHIGMRRWSVVDKDTVIGDDPDQPDATEVAQ